MEFIKRETMASVHYAAKSKPYIREGNLQKEGKNWKVQGKHLPTRFLKDWPVEMEKKRTLGQKAIPKQKVLHRFP